MKGETMSQKPLGAAETSTLIQALITGLQPAQVPVVNRMIAIGVPKNLIDAAVVLAISTEEVVRRQREIISWVVEKYKISPAAALRVLNGETTLLDEQMASQAA